MRFRICLIAFLGAWMLTAAGPAGAATLTLGGNLGGDLQFDSVNAATYVNIDVPGAMTASPVSGTVIGYRVGGTADNSYGVSVLQGRGTRFKSLAAGQMSSPDEDGISPLVPVSLPIRRGQYVGLDIGAGQAGYFNTGGASLAGWQGPLDPGGPFREADDVHADREVAYDAVVRFCIVPNLRHKSVPEAEGLLGASDCKRGRFVARRHFSRSQKQRLAVVAQSVRPGRLVSDTKPIALTFDLKRKRG